MRRAPASRAFSSSSFTAAAGRSMTSPAAIRFTSVSGRRRKDMASPASAGSQILTGEDLALLHGRLIEGIDLQQLCRQHRLQHEVHEETTEHELVQPREGQQPGRTAIADKGLGSGPGHGIEQIAHGTASEIGKPRVIDDLGRNARPLPTGLQANQREELVGWPLQIELQLTMLVDRAECPDRGRAPAFLTQAFRPELPVPEAEIRQAIDV